jgi:hypothetical protein
MAVAAVGSAKEGVKGGILSNGHDLSVTVSPVKWGKIACEQAYFSHIWIHDLLV